jgi:Bifunctional DNA primase/polymerase, N-terminal
VTTQDRDLSLRSVTIASKLHGERVFHRFRCNEPYTRRDGTVTTLEVWTGSCVVCGEPFEVRTARATNRSKVFETTTCPAHRRRNGSASEPEDASLLDPPEVSDLPVTTPEERQAKRKSVIEGMKADRARPALRLVHSVAAPGIEAPPPTPAAISEQQAPLPPARPAPAATIETKSLTPAEIAERNLAAWLALARAEIPTFPVRLNWSSRKKKWDKPPAIEGWQQASTIDEEQIKAWCRDLPAQLGVPAHHLVPGIWCAHPALKLIVVDVDRHDGGSDGVVAFQALVDQNWLPIGPVTKTPSNGHHYIFKSPPGEVFGDHKGSLPDGIDVKGAGLIVGPGSVRPDGAMWRGWPSLVEAFPKGLVPELPDWLAAIIRTPKTRSDAKEAKSSSVVEPTSSDKSSRDMMQRGKAYAKAVLRNGCRDLATMPPNSGRNQQTNDLALQMGTMIARGWIDRDTVFNAIWATCETNNEAHEEPKKTRDTIERAIADGMKSPHPDLKDDPGRVGQQRSGKKDPVFLKLRRTQVFYLLRIRHGKDATYEAACELLVGLEDLDRCQLGIRFEFTFEQYKEIGRRFGKHPSEIAPYDATRKEVAAYLAGIKNSPEKKKAKADAEKARRLRKKGEQQQASAPDLMAQRWAEIVSYAKKRPGKPHTTLDLVRGLKRKEVFAGLDDKTRRNAIVKLVGLAMSGTLPGDHLIIATARAKNGRDTITVEYRK